MRRAYRSSRVPLPGHGGDQVAEKTPVQRFRDAVWLSICLSPEQRIVALCYAKYTKGASDRSWVAQRQLMRETGIRSSVTATRTVDSLVTAGWLKPLGAPPGHQQRRLYQLAVPDEESPATTVRPRGSGGRFAGKETAPPDGAVASTVDRTIHGGEPHHDVVQNRTTYGAEPHHPVVQTAPLSGAESLTDESGNESVREGQSAAADAATLRAASPTDDRSPEAREALADLKRRLAGKPSVRLSKYPRRSA